ncbi:MAG: beta-propeller fold lactonase family protein [Wenzhouxiangellaceae bacterium]|nr:beta-propeller fold lactonase family protein [Wenzhouxiangellaceae bacterium]
MKRIALALVGFMVAGGVDARIDAPDHVLYGNATLFGNPVADGQVIEARLLATGEVIARYELGSSGRLGDQYALRIPMDSVEPRPPGRARPGDPVVVYIADELAGETTVGLEGRAVRLDLDPQNLGTGPAVSFNDVEVFEGNAGTTAATFTFDMNTTADRDVEIFWSLSDGTAVGAGSCGPGVDYVSDSATLVIPQGQQSGTVTVLVCGDTIIEGTETAQLDVNGILGGVPSRPAAQLTIIDDDDVPTLLASDAAALEPPDGQTAILRFEPRLSKNSDFEARVNWSLAPLNAMPGVDYVDASGTVTIAAGDLSAEIPVTLLPSPGTSAPKSFLVRFATPFNLLLDDTEALGVIIDPRFRPAANPEQAVVDGEDGVVGMADPTALALSPDGAHAYVASDSLNALVRFDRASSSGRLTFRSVYDINSPGFETALMEGPIDIAISADGLHVYVAAERSDAIVVLSRNPGDGSLTFLQNQAQGATSTGAAEPNAGLTGVRSLLLSEDGAHLYAAGADDNAVAVFQRDGSSGALQFIEAEFSDVDDPDDAGGTVEAMGRPAGLALSPAGDQLYVASRFGDAVQVFGRDTDDTSASFGALSYQTAYRDGIDGITALNGAYAIEISDAGEHLYVSSEDENAVVLFDRAGDGTLTQRTVVTHDVAGGVPGLQGVQGLALAPDGLGVFVAGFGDHSLSIFERMQPGNADGLPVGSLRLRQTLFDDQGEILTMAGPTDAVASGDDRHVYVVAKEDNAILVIGRISPDMVFTDDFEDPAL